MGAMMRCFTLADIANWPPFREENAQLPRIVAGVPSLQRGLVWKPGKIELLWDSIMRGFPIGSLVVCKKRATDGQSTRYVADVDSRVTHHLLDGQQRAQAIRLGFDEPAFGPGPGTEGPILWLDLQPRSLGETRRFLFRVTTKAHPWGYGADDEASPVGIRKIRDSLRQCGLEVKRDGIPRRPKPNGCWPIEAGAPVPLAWLTRSLLWGETAEAAFWTGIRSRCVAAQATPPHDRWAASVVRLLSDKPRLRSIWDGLQRVRDTRVFCLEVPESALAASGREGDGRDEGVSSIEHLFHRLNRGGTPLDGDELAYSMVKAYWPQLESSITELSELRKLPAARLVRVAARLPFGVGSSCSLTGTRRRLSAPVSVDQIRALAKDGSKADRETFDQFFSGGERGAHGGLATVLEQVGRWCGPADGCDMPAVLQTSIARSSPDVYALLLWMADRAAGTGAGSDQALRTPIQGLVTALHWFALDKKQAVDAVASRLEGGPLRKDAFAGILRHAQSQDDAPLVLLPPSTDRFEASLPQPHGPRREWGCWTALGSRERDIGETIKRILMLRELLIYAQRDYLKRRFDYDPAVEETWAQHNRPWDFDHILPQKHVNRRTYSDENKAVLKEWALSSIANERAWPMEQNRSDQHDRPTIKIGDEYLADSFLTADELAGFDRGVDAIDAGRSDEQSAALHLAAFVLAARSRLVRIYASWYGPCGLDIGFLTK